MQANEPHQNAKRLDVLRSFDVLDSGAEKAYDDLTRLTADLCKVPVCMVSLVDEERQWFKSEVGVGHCETGIDESICIYAVAEDQYLEIPDTHKDPRTVNNPTCQGDQAIRFYAGAILRTLDGWPLGTLCVLDFKPRTLTPLQQRVLKVHAVSVTRNLELTRDLIQIAKTGDDPFGRLTAFDMRDDLIEKTQSRYKTLTPREAEIMSLIAGKSGNPSSKQIAQELDISHRTVDHHRASILSKMDVGSVAELIAISLKTGILQRSR